MAALLGPGFAALAAVATLGSGPALAADRGPILFQPVKDDTGTFVGIGAGPFTTTYDKGVKDDGKTLSRAKVTAENFDTTYTWGSSGTSGGMVIKNISGKPICQITIGILDGSTFPKDVKQYQAPDGWGVAISDDAKKLTFTATKKPDNCVAKGGWFWMKAPASPKPNTPGGATLDGKLALADGDSDAVALASVQPDLTATDTPTDTLTPSDSAAGTTPATPTGTTTPTDPVTSTVPTTPYPSTTVDPPASSDPPVTPTTVPTAGVGS